MSDTPAPMPQATDASDMFGAPEAPEAHDAPDMPLPPLLEAIAHRIGMAATMRLTQHLGGVRIYIPTPERCTEDHQLAKIIGLPNLLALAADFGGAASKIQLPKGQAIVLAARNAEIVRKSRHLSNRQLALEYGMTEDHIRRILTAADARNQHQSAQMRLWQD